MRRWGLEAEYLLENGSISDILKLGIPGITREFFSCMLELITAAHQSPHMAVLELKSLRETLESHGVNLHPYASFSWQEPWSKVQWEDVTSNSPYYRWVYFTATPNPIELHNVGIHLNVSDDTLTEDQLVHATNWLRALSFLFILFTSNSPFRNGVSGQCLSRRSYFFPNRYDVPLWTSTESFKNWIREQEAQGRIYPGKGRAWMPACPRLANNDPGAQIERIEIRCLDSGTNLPWSIIEGCCELASRIIDHALHDPSLPVGVDDLIANDKEVGRLGRSAIIRFGDKKISVTEIAQEWCRGIPALEYVLSDGSPAELAVARTYL